MAADVKGYKIGKELEKLNTNKEIFYIEYLEDAVLKAKEGTKKGKICLSFFIDFLI